MIWVRICISGFVKDTLLLLLLMIFLFSTACSSSGASEKEKINALIIYQAKSRIGQSFPLPDALSSYLGHFPDVEVSMLETNKWQTGLCADTDIVFYIGTGKETLSQELLSDMRQTPKLVWLGYNIEQYANYEKWQGFSIKGERSQLASLSYRGKELSCPTNMRFLDIDPGTGSEIISLADNYTEQIPYIVKHDNLWYFSLVSFQFPFSLILADILHDILGIQHEDIKEVLIRIEDVSPASDPLKLEKIVNMLGERGYPYAIGVIPARADEKGIIDTIQDSPILPVLKKAQENGATIIQHGFTHQNKYSPATGEGFEFWNAKGDRPLDPKLESQVDKRITEGLVLLAGAGLYPLAFEAPHYAMSKAGYGVLRKHYDLLLGDVQLSDKSYLVTESLPYCYYSYYAGIKVYPTNLGNYSEDDPSSVYSIAENAETISTVRDADMCFFYHCYFSADELEKIINRLTLKGYSFVDLREYDLKAKCDGVKISSYGNNIQVDVADNLLSRPTIKVVNRYFGLGMNGLIIILSTIILMLFLGVVYLQRRKRVLYERER